MGETKKDMFSDLTWEDGQDSIGGTIHPYHEFVARMYMDGFFFDEFGDKKWYKNDKRHEIELLFDDRKGPSGSLIKGYRFVNSQAEVYALVNNLGVETCIYFNDNRIELNNRKLFGDSAEIPHYVDFGWINFYLKNCEIECVPEEYVIIKGRNDKSIFITLKHIKN